MNEQLFVQGLEQCQII